MTKLPLVYRLLTGSRTQNHRRHRRRRRHNLTEIESSEADRHPDMAARKAEPLIEAVGGAVAIALDEANRTGRIKHGDYVLMVVFGGGLTWASTVIEW